MGEHKTHHGRNVKRLREILGVKQEALAIELGKEWNQKKISMLEAKEEIDEDLLERVAAALHVPKEKIEHYDDEKMIYNIQNNYEGSNPNASNFGASNNASYYECSFNPLDKMMELFSEIKKLYEEKELLYERLLEESRGK